MKEKHQITWYWQEASERNQLSSLALLNITAKAQLLSLEAPPLANTFPLCDILKTDTTNNGKIFRGHINQLD